MRVKFTLSKGKARGCVEAVVGEEWGGELVAYIQLWRKGFFKKQWDFWNCTVIVSISAYTGKT